MKKSRKFSQPKFLYTLISNGPEKTITDVTNYKGNFQIVAEEFNEDHMFHFMKPSPENPYFLTLTTNIQPQLAEKFLAIIEKKFNERLNFDKESMNEFIKSQMRVFNGKDSMDILDEELDQLTKIVVKNTNEFFERGNRLSLLVRKTEEMKGMGFETKKLVKEARRRQWWDNIKAKILLIFSVLAIIYILFSMFCGGLDLPRCTA